MGAPKKAPSNPWRDAELKVIDNMHHRLSGAQVIRVYPVEDPDTGDIWTRILFLTSDDQAVTLEISQDPEGNGPGALLEVSP